jgi:transposase-like protein
VGHRSTSDELVDATVVPATKPGAMVYTDDWNGYKPLGRNDRGHATVNHNRGEFARDDDGDGIREVHCNTLEGIWTGLRNFLRPFRGVNKMYLEQYVIMFEWSYNLKAVTDEFLRILLGAKATTKLVTWAETSLLLAVNEVVGGIEVEDQVLGRVEMRGEELIDQDLGDLD